MEVERDILLKDIQRSWDDVCEYTEEELENDDEKWEEKYELLFWAECNGFKLNESTNKWYDERIER